MYQRHSEGIEVTIVTNDDVMLDGVAIETDNHNTPLRTTVNQSLLEREDQRLMKERTLLFDTTITPDFLVIEGMHYMKRYENVIQIPVD